MNKKEAIKLAVVETQMKNIETKLDNHMTVDKLNVADNKKQQKEIINKLGVFKDLLAMKADKTDVEGLKIKFAYYAGAAGVLVFIITLIVNNLDKLFGGV